MQGLADALGVTNFIDEDPASLQAIFFSKKEVLSLVPLYSYVVVPLYIVM